MWPRTEAPEYSRPVNMWGHPCYNRNNPLVEGVAPHIYKPPPGRWRPLNMWGHPFDQGVFPIVITLLWGVGPYSQCIMHPNLISMSQSMTCGSFPGLCNLVLQVLGIVCLIYDMWLTVSCWCIFSIHDMCFFPGLCNLVLQVFGVILCHKVSV